MENQLFRKCNKCGKTLPLNSDYFDKDKTGFRGFRGQCKSCRLEIRTNSYFKNENKTMKTTYSEVKIDKQKATLLATKWNEVRLLLGSKEFSPTELRQMAIACNAKYVCHYSAKLTQSNYVDEVREIVETSRLRKYRFAGVPIHYSFFISNAPKFKTANKDEKTLPLNLVDMMETKDNNEIINEAEEVKQFVTIKTFSDSDLVTELRLRGFEVTAKKTIEL